MVTGFVFGFVGFGAGVLFFFSLIFSFVFCICILTALRTFFSLTSSLFFPSMDFLIAFLFSFSLVLFAFNTLKSSLSQGSTVALAICFPFFNQALRSAFDSIVLGSFDCQASTSSLNFLQAQVSPFSASLLNLSAESPDD